jgi:hypothetical protein
MTTTWWQHNNMVAAQNMVQTLLATDHSTKGKKVEKAILHAKQNNCLHFAGPQKSS